MNSFSEKFKKTSDQALLHVLEFSEQYEPEALEAALDELERRNLGANQTATARQAARDFEANKKAKEDKSKKRAAASNKQMKQLITKIEFWKEEPADARFKYKLLLFLSSMVAAYGLYWIGYNLFYLITGVIDSEVFIYLMPALLSNLLFLLGVVLAFKRLRNGWIILLGVTFYRFIASATGLISLIGMLDTSTTDDLFISPLLRSLVENIAFLIVYTALIYLLLQKSIREIFRINPASFMAALITAVFIALLFIGWLIFIPLP